MHSIALRIWKKDCSLQTLLCCVQGTEDGDIQIFAPGPKQAAPSSHISADPSAPPVDSTRNHSSENGSTASPVVTADSTPKTSAISSKTQTILNPQLDTELLNADPDKHSVSDSKTDVLEAERALSKKKQGAEALSRPVEGPSAIKKKATTKTGGLVDTVKPARPVCDEQSVKEINDYFKVLLSC